MAIRDEVKDATKDLKEVEKELPDLLEAFGKIAHPALGMIFQNPALKDLVREERKTRLAVAVIENSMGNPKDVAQYVKYVMEELEEV